ncbi:MAG: peptide chain release factor-like protein [Undibacterium sp.]|nr:peptide chain release factor-like protein [Opitutaceae bacterium]
MNKVVEARLTALGVRISDVDERFILGSGHGGQKLQKTSSCVWLRHRPTGVETRCQRERSQSANRELAWMKLCAKLEERQRAERAKQTDEREQARRRNRPKSRGQKNRMIQSKKHRAGIKAQRGQPDGD